MQIRTAKEEDIPSIQKLISSGGLIGFLCALPSKDHNSMFIMQICTDKTKSGRGIATGLLECLRKDCVKENITSMEFSICSDNEKSLGLFRSFAQKCGGKIERTEHMFFGDVCEVGYRLEFR